MLRWLGPRKAPEPAAAAVGSTLIPSIVADGNVTDDPLAVLAAHRGQKQIYSVSRVNPLFQENCHHQPTQGKVHHQRNPAEKSTSSGYGGSSASLEPIYEPTMKLRDDAVAVLEQNPTFVKSIRVPARTARNKSLPSSASGSSGAGTLTTIPEGRVDLPIPQPIWPLLDNRDSLVDDALLLYTSLNYVPDKLIEDQLEISVREILVELLNNINATMDGSAELTAEEMLKIVNEKIAASVETLKTATEDEMKKLCVNLSNCKKLNSVLRAFSQSSSSSNSSHQSSPEWNRHHHHHHRRVRTMSNEDDLYQLNSGSSSSGFSDLNNALPVFIHEDLGSVPNGVRNAMIYGTLCRGKCAKPAKAEGSPKNHKNSLLRAANDNKPSVWEQYYGVRAAQEGEVKYVPKPTDVPLFPGGRPEADFTLDLPRSEMLSKRMEEDKKWRCRCRLLTSFLGLVFFLLSVMAVSLMLTRGKRMFGSMM